jgi:hypothetical protein
MRREVAVMILDSGKSPGGEEKHTSHLVAMAVTGAREPTSAHGRFSTFSYKIE